MHYVDSYGEVFSKEELIQEIERLLNHIPSKEESFISLEIAKDLDIQTLGSIRENLLKKNGQEISNNQEWLFSLVDS